MRKYIANIVTGFRVICSILLLFFSVYSTGFFITYILCGISDMIDGIIARKTDTISEFGARFDTVADFMFFIICVIKILPLFDVSNMLLIFGVIIAIIKIVNVIWCYIRLKQIISMHTVLNKITGFLLFIFPLTITFIDMKCGLVVVCIMATISTLQECYIVKGLDIKE